MNPDQLIMTLDSNADIELEANVDTGKGYLSAEVAEDEDKTIGEIKLDAMFSPVKKASYKDWIHTNFVLKIKKLLRMLAKRKKRIKLPSYK